MAHFKIDYTITLSLEAEADDKIDADYSARVHKRQLEEALCEMSGHTANATYTITGLPVTDEIDIYFDDLTPEKQKELLDFADVTTPFEMHWDVFPVTTIEI